MTPTREEYLITYYGLQFVLWVELGWCRYFRSVSVFGIFSVFFKVGIGIGVGILKYRDIGIGIGIFFSTFTLYFTISKCKCKCCRRDALPMATGRFQWQQLEPGTVCHLRREPPTHCCSSDERQRLSSSASRFWTN